MELDDLGNFTDARCIPYYGVMKIYKDYKGQLYAAIAYGSVLDHLFKWNGTSWSDMGSVGTTTNTFEV